MDHRLDDRRRLLHRRGGHRNRRWRSGCGGRGGFTRKVSSRQVREEPGQSKRARSAAECGQATYENRSVSCGLLWRLLHQMNQSSCGVGLGLVFGFGELAGGCGAGFDFRAGGGGS
jgi:hypothetical protein